MDQQTSGPDREAIERRAYELYLARGGMDGDPERDWYDAEREMQTSGPTSTESEERSLGSSDRRSRETNPEARHQPQSAGTSSNEWQNDGASMTPPARGKKSKSGATTGGM